MLGKIIWWCIRIPISKMIDAIFLAHGVSDDIRNEQIRRRKEESFRQRK